MENCVFEGLAADCVSTRMKGFRKFCPLCYKQVIALSPRRIKVRDSGNFVKTLKIRVKIYPLFYYRYGYNNNNSNNNNNNNIIIIIIIIIIIMKELIGDT